MLIWLLLTAFLAAALTSVVYEFRSKAVRRGFDGREQWLRAQLGNANLQISHLQTDVNQLTIENRRLSKRNAFVTNELRLEDIHSKRTMVIPRGR